MGIFIKKSASNPSGYRPTWYANFRVNGKTKEVNLNVAITGTPPPSLSVKDSGNTSFEKSRERATASFASLMEEIRGKGACERLTEKMIELKTGCKPHYDRLDELADRWNGMGRPTSLSESRIAQNEFVVREFAASCKRTYLYEVTEADVNAYFKSIKDKFAWSTVQSRMNFLSGAFNRFLPHGLHNPFKSILRRNATPEAGTIHHEALSNTEIEQLRTTAKAHTLPFVYPMVECAICTGARLKDICFLEWINVDISEGFITFNAHKTGSKCELPIFPPLRVALEKLWKNRDSGEIYVFPDAANMYTHNRSGIVRIGKTLFAKSLFGNESPNPADAKINDDTPQAPRAPSEVLDAISALPLRESMKQRMKDIYSMYAVDKLSYRQIEQTTKIARSTISATLKDLEKALGEKVVRFDETKPSMRDLLKRTRTMRIGGERRAVSTYGWHSFRTAFCTMAICNRIPEALIIKAVGHATFKTTMASYMNPNRALIKEAWQRGMDSTAIGCAPIAPLTPAIDIQSVA